MYTYDKTKKVAHEFMQKNFSLGSIPEIGGPSAVIFSRIFLVKVIWQKKKFSYWAKSWKLV